MTFWSTYQVQDNRVRQWINGPLDLWMRVQHRDLLLAVERRNDTKNRDETALAQEAEPPMELEWQRWAVAEDQPTLHLRPVMPDRPVVVRPESPLILPPGITCIFYAMIPIWVELSIDTQAEPQPLVRLPHVILSSTWFGDDTMKGVLCYAMRTTARRNRDDLPLRPHRAICPIKITNDSEEDLECSRFCLRGEHMSLYLRNEQLYTSGVSIVHRGVDAGQKLTYQEKRPDETHIGELITPAEKPVRGSLLSKSIANIRIHNFLKPDWL